MYIKGDILLPITPNSRIGTKAPRSARSCEQWSEDRRMFFASEKCSILQPKVPRHLPASKAYKGIRSIACLKRKLSPVNERICTWCTKRSTSADVSLVSPKMEVHWPNSKLDVTITLCLS